MCPSELVGLCSIHDGFIEAIGEQMTGEWLQSAGEPGKAIIDASAGTLMASEVMDYIAEQGEGGHRGEGEGPGHGY